MKIRLDDHYKENFVYSIPKYIELCINNTINENKCIKFKEEFNIDVKDILLYAAKTSAVRHINDYYIIVFCFLRHHRCVHPYG